MTPLHANTLFKEITSVVTEENERFKDIFLCSYYLLIAKRIRAILQSSEVFLPLNSVESLINQVANYSYSHHLKYVYTYELKLAEEYKLLSGETSYDKEKFFRENLSLQRDWVLYFFEKYPHLLNILQTYLDCIEKNLSKLLYRYSKDQMLLGEHFSVDSTEISEISLFSGDLHDGECVSCITLSDGTRLYYKPRDAQNEVLLGRIVLYMRKIGIDINLGIPQHLDRKDYSWHKHIEGKTCSQHTPTPPEYYYNLGRLQCLFYILGSRDIIPDNILFHEGTPYIIDCESLVTRSVSYVDSTKITKYLHESVLQTGILPDWIFNNMNDRSNISSILFSFNSEDLHLPSYNGIKHPITRETLQDFSMGFEDCYKLILLHRTEIADHLKDLYSGDNLCRILLHPTVIYTHLLEEATTPPYLHGSKNIRDLVQKIVPKESYSDEDYTRLVDVISEQICLGNVPYFYSISTNCNLWTRYEGQAHIVLPSFYSTTNEGYKSIEQKLHCMTNLDLAHQSIFIDTSIKFFLDMLISPSQPTLMKKQRRATLSPISIIRAILNIEHRISSQILRIEDEISAICRTRNPYDGRYQISIMNNSLYDGLIGLCIFYRSLYHVTSDPNHSNIADMMFRSICTHYMDEYIREKKEDIPISPMAGISGLIYLMERYPDTYYNQQLYSNIVATLGELIPTTSQYDFMSGLSGLIPLIYECQLINQKDRNNLLRASGKRLLELGHQEKDIAYWTYIDGAKNMPQKDLILGGFAHGSSSIAVALLYLYRATKDAQYLSWFNKTLEHDRSFFSPEIKGWRDGRDIDAGDGGSWCHGAAGIALSRLLLISHNHNDEFLATELDIAKGLIQNRLGGNLSICHGTIGNLEILNALLCLSDKSRHQLHPFVQEWLSSIVDYINNGTELICGDDNKDSQLGMFMGMAGIGYQLLRFLDWEKLPSIMALEVIPSNIILH